MNVALSLALLVSVSALIDASCCSGGCSTLRRRTNVLKKSINRKAGDLMSDRDAKKGIQDTYSTIVKQKKSCCPGRSCCSKKSDLSQEVGYTRQELEMFADANLGLGCGHPVSFSYIKEGDVVLDLGSGAGLDCFLAALKVGQAGRVIGIDMTQDMIDKARENAQKYAMSNVEFRLGDIESLPVENDSIDVVMSNCVFNLAPNKQKAFQEVFRVLKVGGKMAISDLVLFGQLTDEQRKDPRLDYRACIKGAVLKQDYLAMLQSVGFEVEVLSEDKEISRKWFNSDEFPVSSLKFVAYKK